MPNRHEKFPEGAKPQNRKTAKLPSCNGLSIGIRIFLISLSANAPTCKYFCKAEIFFKKGIDKREKIWYNMRCQCGIAKR